MSLSSPDWIKTEITSLTPCTQYTVEIAAGPHVHGEQQDVSAEYKIKEEELLEEGLRRSSKPRHLLQIINHAVLHKHPDRHEQKLFIAQVPMFRDSNTSN